MPAAQCTAIIYRKKKKVFAKHLRPRDKVIYVYSFTFHSRSSPTRDSFGLHSRRINDHQSAANESIGAISRARQKWKIDFAIRLRQEIAKESREGRLGPNSNTRKSLMLFVLVRHFQLCCRCSSVLMQPQGSKVERSERKRKKSRASLAFSI